MNEDLFPNIQLCYNLNLPFSTNKMQLMIDDMNDERGKEDSVVGKICTYS